MDKRKTTRVIYNVKAEISYDNGLIQGEVINLSLTGMFLKTTEKIPVNTKTSITLFLIGSTSELKIQLTGIVIRTEKKGIAIQFKEIDLDSFIHIKSIVAYNEGDEDKIMDEFYRTLKKR